MMSAATRVDLVQPPRCIELPTSTWLGVAHLLAGEAGARFLSQTRTDLVGRVHPPVAAVDVITTSSAAIVPVTSATVAAPALPLVLKDGDDLWRIRCNLVQQCHDRRMHLPASELRLTKDEFMQRYRYETRGANAPPDLWQALHLYAETEPRAPEEGRVDTGGGGGAAGDWMMPPPPPLPRTLYEDMEREMAEEDEAALLRLDVPDIALVDRINLAPRPGKRAPPGVLIVCFKTSKIALATIVALQTYVRFFGMTWVDLYFVTKPGKTLREEIARRLVGVRVQQFLLDQRRHCGIKLSCLSPASVTALTPQERADLLRTKEKKASQIPGSKSVSTQVDKSDPCDAYYGHVNQQIVQFESRYGSEIYYRCVGNRK